MFLLNNKILIFLYNNNSFFDVIFNNTSYYANFIENKTTANKRAHKTLSNFFNNIFVLNLFKLKPLLEININLSNNY